MQDYIFPNLANYSRIWMSLLLLSGAVLLLPPSPRSTNRTNHRIIQATFSSPLIWPEQTTNQTITTTNTTHLSAMIQSPIHSQIAKLESLLPENEKNLAQQLEQHRLKPKSKRLPRIQGAQQQLRKLHKPKTSKTVRPPNQLMLQDIPGFTQKTETISLTSWGHEPELIDENATFRVIFNNPNGIKLSSDPLSVQYSLSLLSTMGMGALRLAETIVNWSNSHIYQTYKN
jgi:hypothetical protein